MQALVAHSASAPLILDSLAGASIATHHAQEPTPTARTCAVLPSPMSSASSSLPPRLMPANTPCCWWGSSAAHMSVGMCDSTSSCAVDWGFRSMRRAALDSSANRSTGAEPAGQRQHAHQQAVGATRTAPGSLRPAKQVPQAAQKAALTVNQACCQLAGAAQTGSAKQAGRVHTTL